MSDTQQVFKCKECGGEFPYEPTPHPLSPGKFLFGPTVCEPCIPVLEERRVRQQHEENMRDKEREWAEICPPLFLKTDESMLPKEQLDSVLSWRYKPKGLLLHGITGRGKTRIVWLLLRQEFFKGNVNIKALTAAEFSRQSSDYASKGESEKWAERLVKTRILFIDDLGKGRLTERNESDLFDIIDRRTAYERPIIVTTNSVGDELQKRLDPDRGAPLIRRLREFCDCIAF